MPSEPLGEPFPIPDIGKPVGAPAPQVLTGPKIALPLVQTPEPPTVVPPTKVVPPVRKDGLPDWVLLVTIIVAFGLAFIADALTKFFQRLAGMMFGPLIGGRKIPTLDPQKVTQALTSPLGDAIMTADPSLGGSFAHLGALTSSLAHEVAANAQTDARIVTSLQAVAGRQTGVLGAAAAEAKRATIAEGKLSAGARATATRQEAQITHVTHVIEPELEALRKRIPELQKGLDTAWKEIDHHSHLLTEAAMAATVAAALGSIGGSYIRCEANQLLGKDNCKHGPSRAEKIIRDLAVLAIAFDFKAFVQAAEIVAEGIGSTVAVFEQPFLGNLAPLPDVA